MNPVQQAEERFLRYSQIIEQKALREQDTGIDDFLIVHPQPICPDANATLQYRKEYNCQLRQDFGDGNSREWTVDGGVQSLVLDELESGVVYRVSVRACVADLENGCGTAIRISFKA